jgi:hypothetical protein
MQPFITFREMDESGQLRYYILQREHPHIIGRIAAGEQYFNGRILWVEPAHIPSHNMTVAFDGTLQGNLLPARISAVQEVSGVLEKMAQWFYTNRVSPNPKKYAKWKMKE